jgi:hypothetical protein
MIDSTTAAGLPDPSTSIARPDVDNVYLSSAAYHRCIAI